MKSYLPVIIFLLVSRSAIGQGVGLLSLNELNDRIAAGKDTTFVINFWATWCGSCIKELPNFVQMQEHLKAGKTKVLLVSVDFKSQFASSLVPFVKRKKITAEVFLLNEPNQQEYISRIDTSWSGAIPATLFIKENRRAFFEKEFTYPELLKEYEDMQ